MVQMSPQKCIYVYISSLTQSAYSLSLFELWVDFEPIPGFESRSSQFFFLYIFYVFFLLQCKSTKETPQKLTQLSSRSHPRHLAGKRTAQKDITINTTSDSQVNSNFPNRWSPASLTFNNYFNLFLYLYITWKLFDFWGIFLNFKTFCQKMKR